MAGMDEVRQFGPMHGVLRVYVPGECDEHGVPLDWEHCQMCDGREWGTCQRCNGHGSLKALILGLLAHDPQHRVFANPFRCADCGHPMSEGTWEGASREKHRAFVEVGALNNLRHGIEPRTVENVIHYSPCDEGCRHAGPCRIEAGAGSAAWFPMEVPNRLALVPGHQPVEASWRQVDVRCLSWPHDLRPEMLAVLCLRCWAAR